MAYLYILVIGLVLGTSAAFVRADVNAFANIKKIGELVIQDLKWSSKAVDAVGSSTVRCFTSSKGFIVVTHGGKDGSVSDTENKSVSPNELRKQLITLGVIQKETTINIVCCYPMMVAREATDPKVKVLFSEVNSVIRLARNFGTYDGAWPVMAEEEFGNK